MIGKPLIGYADKGAKPRPKPTPVVKVNKERGGHRAPENVNEPLRAFVRTLPCILAGLVNADGIAHRCSGPVVCCHGVTWAHSLTDENNVFPGCGGIGGAHAQQEGRTKEFEMHWPVRVKPVCRRVTARFYREYPKASKSGR